MSCLLTFDWPDVTSSVNVSTKVNDKTFCMIIISSFWTINNYSECHICKLHFMMLH